MNTLDLSQFVTTKAQAVDLSARLAAITEQLYRTDFELEKALSEQFGVRKKDLFLSLIRENNVQIGSNTALKDFFEQVQKQLSSLPLLSLTLAFEPSEQTLMTLSQWFLLNLKKQVLFEIIVDTTLIGGATMTFNGKYLDYSLKPKVEAIVKAMLTPPAPQTAPAPAPAAAPQQTPSPVPTAHTQPPVQASSPAAQSLTTQTPLPVQQVVGA